jgi:hypothetical protein
MRPVSFLFPASLFVLACGASAQTMPYPQLDAESGSSVQVRAPATRVYLTEDQARQIRGSYAMSNGWRLKVQTASNYIDARIDNESPMRLRAVSRDRFVSRDGSVIMQFNQGKYGEDMTMSYIPDRRLAQVVVISSQVAQR